MDRVDIEATHFRARDTNSHSHSPCATQVNMPIFHAWQIGCNRAIELGMNIREREMKTRKSKICISIYKLKGEEGDVGQE